jgi:hypothetical protein
MQGLSERKLPITLQLKPLADVTLAELNDAGAGFSVAQLYEAEGHSPAQSAAPSKWGSKGIQLFKPGPNGEYLEPNQKQIRQFREDGYKVRTSMNSLN